LPEGKAVFAGIDACVEPVLTLTEAINQPQAKARGWVVAVPRPNGQPQAQMACPIHFSAATMCYRHTGPETGEHNAQILAALKTDRNVRPG